MRTWLSGFGRTLPQVIHRAVLDLPPEDRLEGTAGAVAVSIMNGAAVVRVHDVRAMVRVARIVDAVKHHG